MSQLHHRSNNLTLHNSPRQPFSVCMLTPLRSAYCATVRSVRFNCSTCHCQNSARLAAAATLPLSSLLSVCSDQCYTGIALLDYVWRKPVFNGSHTVRRNQTSRCAAKPAVSGLSPTNLGGEYFTLKMSTWQGILRNRWRASSADGRCQSDHEHSRHYVGIDWRFAIRNSRQRPLFSDWC